MKKRLLSILLTACLLIGLLPTVALAAEPVTVDTYYLDYATEKNVNITATVVTKEDSAWTGTAENPGWYVVTSEVEIGSRVTVSGDVHLILADGCTLTVNGGIQVQDNSDAATNTPNANALTIYGQANGTGELIVQNVGGNNAAIGGGGGGFYGGSGGKITINGGIVRATGNYGAAIGGGGSGDYGGNGGEITINGGIVRATGNHGAAIGGGGYGQGGAGGKITINGGTVIAESTNGAGIGGGGGVYNGSNGTFQTNSDGSAVIFASTTFTNHTKHITDQSHKGDWSGIIFEGDEGQVYGATVTPTEDFTIESGKTLTIDSGKTLTIPAGVTMTVAEGGTLTNNGTIINFGIIDGTVSGNQPKVGVTAKYLDETGTEQTCTNAIEVTGSDTQWGADGKTTWYVVQGDVSISQGVTFSGDVHLILADGCDLTVSGGIMGNSGANLTIYGQANGTGTLTATGSNNTSGSSYGIYACLGDGSNGGNITISGGTVKAEGGTAAKDSCGIYAYGYYDYGNSEERFVGGNITIDGNAKVTANGGTATYNSCGIYTVGYYDREQSQSVGGNLTISGNAEVNATGNDAETISCGIYVHNQLTIDGSTVKAEVGSAADSNGIYANKQLTITDSTVKVKVGDAKDFSKGIATFGSVTITGGSVEVKAGTAGTSSTGILASGDVTITGGSHVTVHAPGNGTNGHAMNKSPQLPATYWWRTADTDSFTASGTEPYVHYYGDDYVEFTDSFTITLDPNFDGGESGAMTTGTDGKLTETLPVLTRDGYTFDGWFTAATGGTEVTNETVFNGYVTIYAHWTAKSSGGGSSSGGVSTYAITVESAKNGTVTLSPKTASKGTTVTLTVKPDKGYTLETLTVTDKNGNEIELTNKGDGKYTFKMPGSKVTVKATFMEDNSMLNFFVDVFPGDYYYDAVLWAAENGITGGVNDVHFAPNAPCTRAQIVTFLWRAAGSPEPETMSSFADVTAESYYAKAVAWAVENGITTGTGDGKFSPDATCTRAQAMAFIYRSEQARGGGMQGEWMFLNPFDDVNLESYYGEAVMWAVANGITNGASDTTFSPNNDCTRAQIVTFLYRFFVK